MAITRAFGGQTLLKPGAYSVSRVDNAQGLAVGDNDTIMLIGEASDGIPGGIENSRVFTTSQIQGLVDYYVSGDLVDAALAAARPSITPGISGPTNYIIYKTNGSLFANHVQTITQAAPVATTAVTVSIEAIYPINASGQTFTENISVNIPIGTGTLADPTASTDLIVSALVQNANLNSLFNISNTAGVIDIIAKKAGSQFGPIFTNSAFNPNGRVEINITFSDTQIANAETFLSETVADGTGTGTALADANDLEQLGNTTTAQLTASFTDAFNFDSNVIVPLWSNAATGAVAQNRPDAGINHTVITYPIAAAQLQSHLIERSSVTVRKEAQGIIGANDADWRTTYATLNTDSISSFLVQACIQDIRVIDSLGALNWKGPHILAAVLAGIRLGSTVGEPLTFKFVNGNGIGHNIDARTGLPIAATTQFRPGFDFNEAITQGLTFTELASGGNRIVVDNTRYAIDESFVFNRGSVIEAAQFVARTSRNVLEAIFVGQKVSNGAAESLKNVLRNYLISLNADNIITSSSDAPFGFVEDTFTVSITGNTAEIQVEVKPVQGLDFIFINFTLGNITQSA